MHRLVRALLIVSTLTLSTASLIRAQAEPSQGSIIESNTFFMIAIVIAVLLAMLDVYLFFSRKAKKPVEKPKIEQKEEKQEGPQHAEDAQPDITPPDLRFPPQIHNPFENIMADPFKVPSSPEPVKKAANPKLKNYIKQKIEKGFNAISLKQALVKHGWKEQDVNQAITEVTGHA